MNPPPPPSNNGDHDEDFLNLSLSTRRMSPTPVVLSDPYEEFSTLSVAGPIRRRRAARRPSNQILQPGQSETIPPPYPWATNRRAVVYSLRDLLAKGLEKITGEVQCRRCERIFSIEYNLRNKFREVIAFIRNRDDMRHRAPPVWMNPALPDCRFCGQSKCVKPVMLKKRAINWLFLLLGQMVGCCTLSELKYFCKHTRNHRTGAKDRVLYLTYLELCRQLDPEALMYNP